MQLRPCAPFVNPNPLLPTHHASTSGARDPRCPHAAATTTTSVHTRLLASLRSGVERGAFFCTVPMCLPRAPPLPTPSSPLPSPPIPIFVSYRYVHLPVGVLPPLFLAYSAFPKDSGKVHSPVKQRWLEGDKEVGALFWCLPPPRSPVSVV